MCHPYLGQEVTIKIDQPFGSFHAGEIYELNYGYVPDTIAPDGECLDAYFWGERKPLAEAKGICIAIIHRFDDDDDKLILSPNGEDFSDEEIEEVVHFREQYFSHCIVRE